MSTALDLRAALAATLAGDIGRVVTITFDATGTYDAATGIGTPGAPASKSGRGRVGDYSDFVANGVNIRQGDRRITFQPDDWSFVPQPGQRATPAGDAPLTIVNVKPRELAGVPFAYTLQVRKG